MADSTVSFDMEQQQQNPPSDVVLRHRYNLITPRSFTQTMSTLTKALLQLTHGDGVLLEKFLNSSTN
jgi:hypothetical protein